MVEVDGTGAAVDGPVGPADVDGPGVAVAPATPGDCPVEAISVVIPSIPSSLGGSDDLTSSGADPSKDTEFWFEAGFPEFT